MSQTATLSDFIRTPFDGNAVYCGFETAPRCLSSVAAVSTGLWELILTAFMLVLAPVVLVALAGAFVVACLRIHASELGTESEIVAAAQPPVAVQKAAARESVDFNARARMAKCFVSDHLWN